jgi:hypothetical protein
MPEWLAQPSNADVFARWLADPPGHAAVPEKIKQSLFNTKSMLRKESRKKPGRRRGGGNRAAAQVSSGQPSSGYSQSLPSPSSKRHGIGQGGM